MLVAPGVNPGLTNKMKPARPQIYLIAITHSRAEVAQNHWNLFFSKTHSQLNAFKLP